MIARSLFGIALALLALVYYYGLGPPPTPSELMDMPWWRPRGFLVRWARHIELGPSVGEEGAPWALVIVGALLPLLVGLFGVRWFESAVSRCVYFGVAISATVLALAGLVAPIGWSFFEWRFVMVVAATALFVSAALFAPSLLGAALRSAPALRATWIALAAVVIYVVSTEVTGWEPSMPANLSPWPVVTLFGFLFFGYAIASLHVAAGLGTALASSLKGTGGRIGGALVAAVVGALATTLLVSNPTVGFAVLIGLASAVYAFLALRGAMPSPALRTLGLVRASAGILLAAAIFFSNWAGERNHENARNHTAQAVVDALEQYRLAEGEYPEALDDLVPVYFEEIPRPRIGVIAHDDERFTYLNFGDSYALEFPSILWMQCAYSPPFVDTYEDEEEELDEDVDVAAGDEVGGDLEGSWSCDKAPPPLW